MAGDSGDVCKYKPRHEKNLLLLLCKQSSVDNICIAFQYVCFSLSCFKYKNSSANHSFVSVQYLALNFGQFQFLREISFLSMENPIMPFYYLTIDI